MSKKHKYDILMIISGLVVCCSVVYSLSKFVNYTPPPENTVVKIECDKGVPRLVVSDGKNLYYMPVQDAQGFYECGE